MCKECASDKAFKYELGQSVKVSISGETGVIKGRAEYTNCIDGYFVHYLAADGRAQDRWFNEDEITQAG